MMGTGEMSKIGHRFSNNMILYQKMSITKNVPKLVFFNEKNEKDSDDF